MESPQEGFKFEVLATDPTGARSGRLTTPHGIIDTPAFMPVGTAATVKGQTQQDLEDLGVQILLSQHLPSLPPPRPRTHPPDGRPAQIHVLAARHPHRFRRLSGLQPQRIAQSHDEGVTFRSHLDGSEHFLSPEKALEIEIALGADIIMVLDECIEAPSDGISRARSRRAHARLGAPLARLFRAARRSRAPDAFRHRARRHARRAAPRKCRRSRRSRFSRLRHRRPRRRRAARDHLRNDAKPPPRAFPPIARAI